MIFSFDDSIQTAKVEREMASALELISKKKHQILCSLSLWTWIENTILYSDAYLGRLTREEILKNKAIKDITGIQNTYCTTIHVGYLPGILSLQDIVVILKEPSFVVLENGMYDWAVITKWAELLKNDRTFKDINRMVCDAINSKELQGEHAGGGNGTISNRLLMLKPRYGNAAIYKLTAIFDSDKRSIDDECHNTSLINFLSIQQFKGHELHKREMENYFPLKNYHSAGMVKKRDWGFPTYSEEEWDYEDIEQLDFIQYSKNFLPRLTEYIEKKQLLQRVDHHKIPTTNGAPINEIQSIILLLAKYI